ncbi:stage III sporulation protein AA [Paenibacillus sp. 7124]|uniref:Stage III sporulation protein AA n=1 Tax=Paenibacillus apii TaxID=1850370 RepID=A0A6M1PGZ0_9BACL|nr:stage III sporulation protein AA [Paenibacillus apii]NGM81638.1 stage III sporulation protein AA [Paenibacillus apii]NJJ41472.1 stage III sporulation protein AA [Paenibacillus apii]
MATDWLQIFPEKVKAALSRLPLPLLETVEEIRIREGRPLEINYGGKYHFVDEAGRLTLEPEEAYKPNREDSHRMLDLISNHSLYTMEEELRKGFITIPGGHRIGLAGRTVLSSGSVGHLRDIGGFNVRIAREIPGVADRILPLLLDDSRRRVMHTLILSPPQHGKTTLLRDLARQISAGSAGDSWRRPGLKVGIVDERSEIAGSRKGVPSFDIGPRTDVLDGCPKAEGMMMMIRSLSPDVLIADEIGRPEDAEALTEALHAGITVLAAAHGREVSELALRPGLGRIIELGVFERYVILRRAAGELTFRVLDGRKRPLPASPGERKGGECHA